MKTKNLLKGILALCFVFSFALSYTMAQGQLKTPQHYSGVVNTGDNMTVGIPDDAWLEKPQIGDEIGAFNPEGILVGSTVYNGSNCAITIWGDDETTKLKEGVSSGLRFSLRVWHKETGTEDIISVERWLEGDDIYKTNGISVVEKLQLETFTDIEGTYSLEQNVPNPAKNLTKIDFAIPTKTHVKIVLFTSDGKLVRELLSEDMSAGTHNIEVNVNDLASGTYYYKMVTTDYSSSKYLNVVK